MLDDVFNNPGIKYNHGYFINQILTLWPGTVKDYGDAVLAAAEHNITVLTFDKLFSRQLPNTNILYELIKSITTPFICVSKGSMAFCMWFLLRNKSYLFRVSIFDIRFFY